MPIRLRYQQFPGEWGWHLDSADDIGGEEPRKLDDSVIHDRVDQSATRLISPSTNSIESEVLLLPFGFLEPEPDELNEVPGPEATRDGGISPNRRRLPFIQYHIRLPMGHTFLPSRARSLVAVVVAAAATVYAMDVLPTRVEEDEDATEPAVEFRRGCTIVTPSL